MSRGPLILWFPEIRRSQVGTAGGKNASLGEMIGPLKGAGTHMPEGFATTANAYSRLLSPARLRID